MSRSRATACVPALNQNGRTALGKLRMNPSMDSCKHARAGLVPARAAYFNGSRHCALGQALGLHTVPFILWCSTTIGHRA